MSLWLVSLPAWCTTYTSVGIGTWDANGAPPNPLPSGDIVNVNHSGMLFDWPNAVVWQSGSTVNINLGGNISIQSLTIDAGANVNVNVGGTLTTPGHITNNSNNLVINGDITDSGNFINNGNISGSGNLNLGPGSALGGTGSINGTDMGDITYSPGDDLDLSQPLPVILLSFDVSPKNDHVLITWVTASETNNNFFSIERSADATHWNTIGRVTGSGNSLERKTYNFKESHVTSGWWYYRLKQTDYDGQFEYFKTVKVLINSNFVQPGIYSVEDFIYLKGYPYANWQIYNLKGHQVKNGMINNSSQALIPTQDLIPGIYLVQVNQQRHKIRIR